MLGENRADARFEETTKFNRTRSRLMDLRDRGAARGIPLNADVARCLHHNVEKLLTRDIGVIAEQRTTRFESVEHSAGRVPEHQRARNSRHRRDRSFGMDPIVLIAEYSERGCRDCADRPPGELTGLRTSRAIPERHTASCPLGSGAFRGTLARSHPTVDGHTLDVKYERQFVRFSGTFWGLSMSVLVLEQSDLAATPTERLEAEATSLAGHLAAAMCRFLDVVAELAQREAWKTWEARSMAHWVSWKCGVGPRAAQEQVRVAVALLDLPETHAEFAAGQLSYSKVRALTRFLTPGAETDTIVVARHTTAEQLERIARAHGAACRAADPDLTRRALDSSYVSFHTNEDGTITITARVPADVGIRAIKAVDDAASRLPRDPDAEPQTKRVNGFEAVIDAYLEPDPSRSSAVEVIAHVDVEMLSQDVPGRCELEGHAIASETLRRLACDCGVRLSIDADGQILDLGRKARFPNPALRRSVVTRDQGRCRFPGCAQRNRLRAHHARHCPAVAPPTAPTW